MKIVRIVMLNVLVLTLGCTTTVSLEYSKDLILSDLNNVEFYTGYKDEINYENVLLILRGTGRTPASDDFGMGSEAVLYNYVIVHPEKTYVEDEINYYLNDNREQRLHDTSAIMDELIKRGAVNILILADSEGTMFAPEIAKRYEEYISGLICIGGSLFSFREDLFFASSNKLGQCSDLDPVFLEESFAEIDQDPENLNKDFWGHSYKFWSSYIDYIAHGDLKGASYPILYINGEFDEFDVQGQNRIINEMESNGTDISQIIYKKKGHGLRGLGRSMFTDILSWAISVGAIKE